MARRVPASVRTRKSLTDLIEGRLSAADGRAALVKLATPLIVEEALKAESRDALGRDYYEHGASAGQGWRNGVRMGRLKTAEGLVDYAAPQIAGREEPFRSEIRESLKGRTQALENLAVELLAPLRLLLVDASLHRCNSLESCAVEGRAQSGARVAPIWTHRVPRGIDGAAENVNCSTQEPNAANPFAEQRPPSRRQRAGSRHKRSASELRRLYEAKHCRPNTRCG